MMPTTIIEIEQTARQYSRDAAFVKFTDTEVQKIIEAIMQAQSKAAQ